MLSYHLQRLFFLGLTIIAGLCLEGCMLTRDLWQADNVDGRKWTEVPLTVEAFESDDQRSWVRLVVGQDVNLKIRVGEEQFRIRSLRRGEKLVLSAKDPSIAWLLSSAGETPSTKKGGLQVEIKANDDAVSARVNIWLVPKSGMLFTPYSGARIAKIPYEGYQRLREVFENAVDHFCSGFIDYQSRQGIPTPQRSEDLRFAGWIARDGQVVADLHELEGLINLALATRSWKPLEGLSAIIEGDGPHQGQPPAWTVSMEHVVRVGLLTSTSRSVWNEGIPSESPDMLRVTDFGNFACHAWMKCWAEAPTHEFWPTAGRVIATPFTATADVVCFATAVVTAPLWGPLYLSAESQYGR